jgi:DNA processing protein
MLGRMDAQRARATLARTPHLDCRQLTALLAAAGGELTRALEPRTLRGVALEAHVLEFLRAPDDAAISADLEWLTTSGAAIVLCTDRHYPPLLRESADAPAALYVLGDCAALCSPQLAMVGSRHASDSGARTAREFAAWFARAGLTVTSGLGRGIDAASHIGALRGGGLTVAVCGSGLDRIYPSEHAALGQRIAHSGALVSELAPRTPPLREHFQRRSRIIAGLTRGTLVVEAARVSSALATARLAADYGREVFAIPGSIHSPLARGPHQLIKAGAKLVEEAADVLIELKNSLLKEELMPSPPNSEKSAVLDKEYEMLLDAVGFEPATVDSLVARTHLPAESVASMLLILELEGRVAALPAGHYGRLP